MFPWVFKQLRYQFFLLTWDTSRPGKTCSKWKTKRVYFLPGKRKHRRPSKNFTEGLQTPDSPAGPSQVSNEELFWFTFVQSYISHCQHWDSPFDTCCGSQLSSQGGNENIKRSRVLELTSVAFSAEESFAPGKDVQIGLGCVFSSGFQSLSASPI